MIDLINRLRSEAESEDSEAESWDFIGRDNEPANKDYLRRAAIMRDAADEIERLERRCDEIAAWLETMPAKAIPTAEMNAALRLLRRHREVPR